MGDLSEDPCRKIIEKHKDQTNYSIATRQAEKNQGTTYPRKEQNTAFSFMQPIFIAHHLHVRHHTRHSWDIGL